jgi:hypothetical protein
MLDMRGICCLLGDLVDWFIILDMGGICCLLGNLVFWCRGNGLEGLFLKWFCLALKVDWSTL